MVSEIAYLQDMATKAGLPDKKDAKMYKAFFEDIMWSLLNTSEFILNH